MQHQWLATLDDETSFKTTTHANQKLLKCACYWKNTEAVNLSQVIRQTNPWSLPTHHGHMTYMARHSDHHGLQKFMTCLCPRHTSWFLCAVWSTEQYPPTKYSIYTQHTSDKLYPDGKPLVLTTYLARCSGNVLISLQMPLNSFSISQSALRWSP